MMRSGMKNYKVCEIMGVKPPTMSVWRQEGMITYENAESALQYLVNTDDEYARAKTLYDALHEQRKTVEAYRV